MYQENDGNTTHFEFTAEQKYWRSPEGIAEIKRREEARKANVFKFCCGIMLDFTEPASLELTEVSFDMSAALQLLDFLKAHEAEIRERVKEE